MAISIPFLWRATFLLTFIKSQRLIWKLLKLPRLPPRTDLSNKITFSQSQYHGTVPLKTQFSNKYISTLHIGNTMHCSHVSKINLIVFHAIFYTYFAITFRESLLCCSHSRNRGIRWECGSVQHHRTISCSKIGPALGLYLKAWVGPLGAKQILHKPNLAAQTHGSVC